MSVLLYGVGVIAVVIGAAMIGFGIPVHEFSFGNTLIAAGTTAAVGGLVVMGLGVVVAQLQRIQEALATRAPIKSSRQFDTFENAAGARNTPASGRIPFPPRPRADTGLHEPQPFEPRVETAAAPVSHADEPPAAPSFAPTLRNPEEPPVTVEDDVSLLPPHPMAPGPREAAGPGPNEDRYEPKLDAGWRLPPPPAAPAPSHPPQSNYFDAMWPAEPKLAKKPAQELSQEPAQEPYQEPYLEPPKSPVGPETRHEETASPGWRADSEVPMQPPASEPRGAAILKSGVVDGMGYTLYVDGSIEAELPQGTLRFSSIDELRSHLEKNN